MTRSLSCLIPSLLLACLTCAAEAEPAREVPQTSAQVILSYAPIVKTITPAVVNIYAKRKVEVDSGFSPFAGDPFFQQFFGGRVGGMPRERVVSSLGSGVIVDPKGRIVTSNHVIEGGEGIVAVLSDGREFPAKVAVADKSSDLALLTIDTKGEALPALPLANSDALQVGDLVLAVGNPYGVGQTVTSGIVSALARSAAGVSDYQFFIQTDAAINPGNSGGALTDMQGRLIGINTAIYSKTGASNGIGFAIPSNMVAALIRNGQAGGDLLRPWLGGSYESVTPEVADSLGLKRAKGALVKDIYADSPADKAGIKSGDIIVKFGDSEIDSAEALKYRVAVAERGQKSEVTVFRQGKEVRLPITLDVPPETTPRDVRTLKGDQPLTGLTVENLSPRAATDLGLPPEATGVIVTQDREGTGFAAGDRILAVNGTKVTSTRQLETLVAKPARAWKIVFQRGRQVLTYSVVP